MTLFFTSNIDFAWGASAAPPGLAAGRMPLLGVGSWILWILTIPQLLQEF